MTSARRLDPSILREYDIRGVVGTTLGEDDVYAIGRAFGTVVRKDGGRTVVVGFDGRDSSPAFADIAATGIADCGLDVCAVGRGPTPMIYFAVMARPADAGVVITGSHNPPEYNGVKLMRRGMAFHGKDILELGRLAAVGDYAVGKGRIQPTPIMEDYVVRLAQAYRAKRGLKVAWDAGNGAAGEAMAALTARLPGEHVLLNETIDGTFPNHHPDPTVAENLAQLIQAVRQHDCDLGVAFDGDGDRIGAVDGTGRIVWADQLMVLFAEDLLARQPGATIISEVKASQVLYDEIARLGGTPLMWKTGHSLLKAKMAETGAPLAGEMSGHIFFADAYYGYDDGLYAAVRLLDILARGQKTLAEQIDRLPKAVNTPELRFPVDEDRKFAIVDEVRRRLRTSGADVIDVDGVRVRTSDGWWLLRASNTQNVLVARCEAANEEGLMRLKSAIAEQMAMSGIDIPGDL
jgi:phosphomannomutase